MATNIKFTKFDNRPWGFRLAGGSDFPEPLTVIRVSEGSLAECMGLKVGDVIVRLNDQAISTLSHGQAHEALNLAGNNFVLAVHRVEDTDTLVEALSKDNIEPYSIHLNDLPPLQPLEEILSKLTSEPVAEESTEKEIIEESFEEKVEIIERVAQKPKDENSEDIPNENLTDEEIAQLIIVEEELLPEKGVLGVNFKKLRPRASLFKDSKVFEELQKEAIAEPPLVQELKRRTTFLQKPERPIPQPKLVEAEENSETQAQETYKVVIKKQIKKTITDRLVEKGLLEPGCVKSSEQGSEKNTPAVTPDICGRSDYGTDSRPESKAEILELEPTTVENKEEVETIEFRDAHQETRLCETSEEILKLEIKEQKEQKENKEKELSKIEEVLIEELSSPPELDKQKLKELVLTEISLEKQLESVQKQLLALKYLPSKIENHLSIVSEQLHRIMELSGKQYGSEGICFQRFKEEEERQEEEESPRQEIADFDCYCVRQQRPGEDNEQRNSASSGRRSQESDNVGIFEMNELHYDGEPDSGELEISIKSTEEDEESRVKKYIVSYETKVEKMTGEFFRSRDPSPITAQSPGSNIGDFEPDLNKDPKEQLIEELKHRQEKKRSQDLWPQAKQLELTYGRRWRCTNDFFNDDMIAEVLSSQAEVLRGKTLGVNFKKFEKTALPNFDHLMSSSVYKMIHKMEDEPRKGIPARPPKVTAAEDVLERDSPLQNTLDDVSFQSMTQ